MNKRERYDYSTELDDDNLWGRYHWHVESIERHRQLAERDLAELALRGLVSTEVYSDEL